MVIRLFAVLLLLSSIAYVGSGQERKQQIHLADSILGVRGEVYFAFPAGSLNSRVSGFVSIKHIKPDTVFAYANKQGFTNFLSLHIDFRIRQENFRKGRLKSASLANVDSVYPSYPKYIEMMNGFEKKHPGYCHLEEMGRSVEGRKLLALKIQSPANTSSRPAVLLSGSIHGDELTGYKLSLMLAEYLLDNYGKDPVVTRLMDETQLYIQPLVNPDGTYFGGDNTVAEATRFNANNLDLNRNFPDPAEGNHPDEATWQPETVALMNFYKQKRIVLSAILHTGEEVVNYPWDTWSRDHADIDWYARIANDYVSSVHEKNVKYMTKFDNGTVKGYVWYRITGGHQDYVNYFQGGREVTIELSSDDMPDSSTVAKYWEYNRDALLGYLQQSLWGVYGSVTDSETGSPVFAKMELKDHDRDNSQVYTDSTDGIYNRLLLPGNYTMQVSAPGYVLREKDFTLQAQERLNLNFALDKVKDPVVIYPNPVQKEINIFFTIDISSGVKLSLVDLSGRIVYTTTGHVTKNEVSRITLPDIPNGFYILKIESKEFSGEFEIIAAR
ncbi:MAG TPA: M14 family zinc carboxypeptidase [Bacteroidales bacterium]|nr:M14 family zinc carboxypeptidase [Bacteroidales bacterium]